ncbi:hypothetical protein E0K89_001445 [Aquicoccus sp. SCR17]|nr:hypothetical protein [Carideicomes alvinocaridis]
MSGQPAIGHGSIPTGSIRRLSISAGLMVALASASMAAAACPDVAGDRQVPVRPAIVAGSRLVFAPGAYIELRETANPAAVAEVYFKNRPVNGPCDDGIYRLALGEVRIELTFTWDADGYQDDRIELRVSRGFSIAEPTIRVPEGADAQVFIYPALS